MAENEKKNHRLYALPLARENVETAEKARFSRVTTRYVLIYTDGEAPKNGVEIDKAEIARLSGDDLAWIADCNRTIVTETILRNEAEISKSIEDRLSRFEAALKAEKEKQKEG